MFVVGHIFKTASVEYTYFVSQNVLAQAPRVRLVCFLTFALLGGQRSPGDMNRARKRNGKRRGCKIPTWTAKRRSLVWKYAGLETQPYEDATMTPLESISNMIVEWDVETFLQIGMR